MLKIGISGVFSKKYVKLNGAVVEGLYQKQHDMFHLLSHLTQLGNY